MQINWRRKLKVMLGIALAYVALNILDARYDNGIARIPVDIAVSVLDSTNSRPVPNAVASWQARARDLDCQHIVGLLNDFGTTRSSKSGILSPSDLNPWEFFVIVIDEIDVTDEGIPINVIGMTTENGRLDFRAQLGRNLKWSWPRIYTADARNRLLQVDATGYNSKHISLRQEDFSLIDGEYQVKITVFLDPETP